MRLEYFEPGTVEEAVDLLVQGKGRYKPLAGGTDLLIQLRRRTAAWEGLVNLKRLPGFTHFVSRPEGGLRIGAATPFRQLELSGEARERFSALVEAIGVIGSAQLRNTATIGGNLCNASPAADSATPLMVAGATATVVSNGAGTQSIPIREFFAGPGRSILGASGLLLWLDIPEPAGATGESFQRLTPRNAMDIAVVSASSRVTLDPSTGRAKHVAIALGAVAPTPVRATRAEEALLEHEPTPELLSRAAALAREGCSPIDDIRGSASYRRDMVGVLVRRTLARAVERAKRGFAR